MDSGNIGKAVSRDIVLAVAEAVDEHDRWLRRWHRAALCGELPDPQIVDQNAHGLCNFGRWFERHSQTGLLSGDRFVELGRTHREVHEAARYLLEKVGQGEPLPADEYNAMLGAFDSFRSVAERIQEDHGLPEDREVSDDEEIAELQSRMTMLAELEREWERSTRTDTPMCLVMVRPNGLDEIERQYGNLGIDRLVAGLAARLYSHIRPYDAVYRYGRSEFLICLPGADAAKAGAVTSRLDEALDETPLALSEHVETEISARFGIAISDLRASVQEILDRASRAANMAGTAPGERVAIWSPTAEH